MKIRPLTAACALILTTLACILETPDAGGTPAPDFSTATPGGSISVPLLTPTLTLQGLRPDQLTPIGPVATATAAAQLAGVETATASAPTPTPAGIFSAPALCPPPGTPTLQVTAPVFSRYAEVIARYLSAGGAPTILEATLRNWNAITTVGGLVRADRDLTGDGVPEVFLVVLDPQYASRQPQPGDMFIFGCQDGAYRLLYQAGYLPDRAAPVILSADDINGDYVNDVLYVIHTCTAVSCTGEISIIEWNLTLGNFISLTAGPISAQEPRVQFADPDGDRVADVIVTAGVINSPAAGPQREVTTTYRWDGAQFAPAIIVASALQYRIHAIHDGDAALGDGDVQAAVAAYQIAIDNNGLLEWGYPNEREYLIAFARYRLMLAYTIANNISRAQRAHDQLMAQYTAPVPPPVPEGQPTNTPAPPIGPLPGQDYASMADLFWQNFSVNRDIGRACQLVVGFARANPRVLEPLNSFGFANRSYTAEDMCPYGG